MNGWKKKVLNIRELGQDEVSVLEDIIKGQKVNMAVAKSRGFYGKRRDGTYTEFEIRERLDKVNELAS